MSKIERIFQICHISTEIISSVFNQAPDSVQINFVTKELQIFCKNKIKQFLEMYYQNKVSIY